ncbi:MAG: hypothetical protein H8D45_20940 [Bacteroidetes bacterium]|nr:hypothetical protein [Bacteroidota bacterium]
MMIRTTIFLTEEQRKFLFDHAGSHNTTFSESIRTAVNNFAEDKISNPWMEFAGIFSNCPIFDEVLVEMQKYRDEEHMGE